VILNTKKLLLGRDVHPKKTKGLSLGLGFRFFENLGLGLSEILQISCKFRANFEYDILIYSAGLKGY
jgi:hypothetical protein